MKKIDINSDWYYKRQSYVGETLEQTKERLEKKRKSPKGRWALHYKAKEV